MRGDSAQWRMLSGIKQHTLARWWSPISLSLDWCAENRVDWIWDHNIPMRHRIRLIWADVLRIIRIWVYLPSSLQYRGWSVCSNILLIEEESRGVDIHRCAIWTCPGRGRCYGSRKLCPNIADRCTEIRMHIFRIILMHDLPIPHRRILRLLNKIVDQKVRLSRNKDLKKQSREDCHAWAWIEVCDRKEEPVYDDMRG